jgi:hypothetical protein
VKKLNEEVMELDEVLYGLERQLEVRIRGLRLFSRCRC